MADNILAPGLYDANDNLIASWDTLVNTYCMDMHKDISDDTDPTSPCYILKNNSELANGTKFVIDDSVVIVSDGAFYKCGNLTDVIIPNSVVAIGASAFGYCGLTNITIPDSVVTISDYAFEQCNSLRTVIIGEGITALISFAFEGCYNVTSITIPNSVVEIDSDAFPFANGADSISYNIYGNGKYLGNESNPYHALVGCTSEDITSWNVHEDTKVIVDCATWNCPNLTSITIPNGIMSVNGLYPDYLPNLSYNVYDNAKYVGNDINPYCVLAGVVSTDITSCSIHEDTKIIGNFAFGGCSNLTSITIPKGVRNIGSWSFYGCAGLISVDIPNSVISIGTGAFDGCTGLTTIDISNSVKYIGNRAFCETGLTTINIPDSVVVIDTQTFSSCNDLTSVAIPDSVKYIYRLAFHNSNNLNTITIGNGVKCIQWGAFSSAPTDIYYNGTKKELSRIAIGSDNEGLYAATIHYTTTPVASIQYNDSTIASLEEGQTAKLKCAGMLMQDDVLVEVGDGGGSEPVLQKKTATQNGVILPDAWFDGLSQVNVAVVYADGNVITPIDTLDETLLVSGNIGKFYRYGGNVYTIEKTYVPVKDGEYGTAFFLEDGKMITPTTPDDYNVVCGRINGGPGAQSFTVRVPGFDSEMRPNDYTGDWWNTKNFFIGDMNGFVTFPTPVMIEGFCIYENGLDVRQWAKENGKPFYKWGFAFMRVDRPYEVNVLSYDFSITSTNLGKIYKWNGELYQVRWVKIGDSSHMRYVKLLDDPEWSNV